MVLLLNLIVNQLILKIMMLTELQKSSWRAIGDDSTATETIRSRALQFYLDYKEHLMKVKDFNETESKIQNLFLISYFISQKCESLHDMNGNKISNVALSINQIVKKNDDYQDLVYHLKQMVRIINFPAEAAQVQNEILSFIRYFSFVMTFYRKFITTFDKITICHAFHKRDLQNVGGQKQYIDQIKYCLWVIYISFRKTIFENSMDTIGNTCLLACLYTFYIAQIYKQERISSVFAQGIQDKPGTLPNEHEQIQKIILTYFCLKDLKTYQKVRKSFQSFKSKILFKLVQPSQPFSLKKIASSIKNIQQFYYKNMQMNDIDETLFLKKLISNRSNIRFTAFGNNRKVGRHHNNNLMLGRRVIDYEAEIRQIEGNTNTINNQKAQNNDNADDYLNVMHRIKASQTPVMLIQATPVTQFSTAYNWLLQKCNSINENEDILILSSILQVGYTADEYQMDNEQILQKRKMIQGLFCQLISKYPEHTQQNINVCTLISLEVFYYINHIANRQIKDIADFLGLSWFAIWEGIDKLLHYDKKMPNNVKTHLLLLQTTILSDYIWRDAQFIDLLSQNDISDLSEDFFCRIMHHIAYQINFIGKSIPEITQTIMDQSFIVCQYYLKQWNQLMHNNNLDVVIMCSLYGVCRAKKIDMRFNTIKRAYKLVNNLDDKAFRAIQMCQNLDGQTVDIINYYNSVFLHAKSVLNKVRQENLQNDQQFKNNHYMLSPVKQIIPTKLIIRGNCTPTQNQMLLAYKESPLLKRNKSIRELNQNLINQTPRKQTLNSQINKHQTQVLRQRSTNISYINHQMIQLKFGNGKQSRPLARGYQNRQFV